MLKRIFDIFGKTRNDEPDPTDIAFPSISAETEVNIIKLFLERKFNSRFQARVKVEGYLGGEMEYKLIIDDYDSLNIRHEHHSIQGASVKDVLNVRHAFIDSYWRGVERGFNALTDSNLSKWDTERAAELRETAIAGSREEMILRAVAEGLI